MASKVRHADLLNFAVNVLSLAARFIERNFLHEKILGVLFKLAADACEICQ